MPPCRGAAVDWQRLPSLMPYACLLFDHDETLVPTLALRARVLERAAYEITGRRIDGIAYLNASHGRSLEQMAGDLTGEDPLTLERLVAVYREHYYRENQHGLAPFPGVAETLLELSRRGVKIGVVTSKLGRGARAELVTCGLAGFIGCVVGAEDTVRPKPAADPVLSALRALDARPEEALMIGDTTADLLAAKAAGTGAAAALWGAQAPDSLRALAPDFLLRSPEELLALV